MISLLNMLTELLEQIILVGKICWYSLDDSWINLGHALRYWRQIGRAHV